MRKAKMKGLPWLKLHQYGLLWKVDDFNAVGLLYNKIKRYKSLLIFDIYRFRTTGAGDWPK